jgi:hypothetical protein
LRSTAGTTWVIMASAPSNNNFEKSHMDFVHRSAHIEREVTYIGRVKHDVAMLRSATGKTSAAG